MQEGIHGRSRTRRAAPDAGPDGPDYHPQMQTQRIPLAEGVELAADTWSPAGAAATPPFVLVHGLASNARMWDGVASSLAASGHRVVTVDLRGHGRSSKPEGPYDVPTVAGDLAVLIAGLELDRPVVAGQSWGGNVVVELAARQPDAIRGIVCVDGGWLDLGRQFADWDACRSALAPPRLLGRPLVEVEAYVRSAHPGWPESGIRGVLANFEVRPDGTIAPWLTYERHIEILRGLWEHHPSERYAGIGVPVLLVPAGADGGPPAGADGGPTDGDDGDWARRKRRDVETAAAAIPNARVRWLAGDHDVHAQHPHELAGMMLEMTADGFFA
jgi:pimeloyl-ACP methyl ester carboxylesterase